MYRRSCLTLAVFLSFSLIVLALPADSNPSILPAAANPSSNPKADINNPFRYIPNNALTAIAESLFLLTSISLSVCLWRWGAKWMLCLVIGGYAMTIGLILRFPLHGNPDSRGLFIGEDLLVILSPCAFIAADYILLGRLAGKYQLHKYLLIKPQRITKVFIGSDVSTFLIQAMGGSLTISKNLKTAQTGGHILLAGLVLQFCSFLFFTTVYLNFLYRVRRNEPQMWAGTDPRVSRGDDSKKRKWSDDWRTLAAVLIISCIGILIRSVYRTIENAQGYHGKLATTEWCFYVFDTLPLFIAVSVYVPFWPGRFLEFPGGDAGASQIASHTEMNVISPAE